jgi:hypothetical protein
MGFLCFCLLVTIINAGRFLAMESDVPKIRCLELRLAMIVTIRRRLAVG